MHSDHKPLAKFIDGMTKNNKVNNWTMECHAICKSITFDYIEGKKNVLCDSLTRIQYFHLYEDKNAEKPGHLFGKPDCEELDKGEEHEILEITHSEDETEEAEIKISIEKLVRLQYEQQQYMHIRKMVKKNPEKLQMLYRIRSDDMLVKIVRSDNHKFEAIMVLDKITKYILHEAHERLGHPGSVKLYLFLRRIYYWPQLKRDCSTHIRTCVECQQNNLKEPHYVDFSNTIPKFPFSYIAMDLIGPFETTSNGATRCLTCMCLLTGFLFTVPIPDKRAETVINTYLRNVYAITGGSKYILSNHRTEFTSKTFKEIIDRLQLTQTFTSLRNPKGNSILERSHTYLKQGMRKLKANNPMIEWDFALCIVTHSYNITPHTLLGECPIYLFFNRDPYIPGLQNIIAYNL